MTSFFIYLVKLYQKGISPFFPATCRFQPTCSQYMIIAIEKHGLKGILMGIARILRCHPLTKAGEDPVPDHFTLKRTRKR
ncbi:MULTISPECIES: membrane protein insertion efficiency factor YidD [Streptococcus]|uniref:membrane protein insertion efficiency factor YidD n=1 Tax=Streptococcus TaxID=1301 RepID=UPI002A8DE8F6|nr:membrane protein insertion efficiency factor YidD [Streptococcus sp.]MDY3823607.1 membrane protein insertion efficiency factor YidD [Streptococcus sp.]